MERPGEKLKRIREKLHLTYRDVEKASQVIAARRRNDEFAVALSRLADIEHKGTVPTIFRLYTLSAIYRLDLWEMLGWYGVPVDSLAADVFETPLRGTHLVDTQPHATIPVPQPTEAEFDPSRTTFLNLLVKRWGRAGVGLLNGLDLRGHRYGLLTYPFTTTRRFPRAWCAECTATRWVAPWRPMTRRNWTTLISALLNPDTRCPTCCGRLP